MIRLFTLMVPLIAGGLAFVWMPVAIWELIRQDLLLFFSIFAAALTSASVNLLGFLKADGLRLGEVDRLGAAVENLQALWIGLMGAVISSIFLLIIVHVVYDPEVSHPDWWLSFLSGMLVSLCLFIVLHAMRFLASILDLQKTQTELVRKQVQRREEEEAFRIEEVLAVRRAARIEDPIPTLPPP